MINSQTYKKNRSIDIELKLSPIDGKKALSGTGLMDPRLFSGDNSLHAKMDTQTCLWYLEYSNGIVPGALKQKFTGWPSLIKFVTEYFRKRNIQITEIRD